MYFLADLHIHSPYSRATSKDMELETLSRWAQLKGLTVIGTGDFTHPRWFSNLQKKLEGPGDGLYRLKDEYRALENDGVPQSCCREIRFILSSEVSCIYSKGGCTRKAHHLILSPTFEAAAKVNEALSKIGNLGADGRPILGLDSKILLRIVLDASADNLLIPAHVWTPHFSVFGSNSGFDSLEECFEELTPHIYAIETGLSSDPPMNWRLSGLDQISLISNSDAHSPRKLAREANIFDTELSYKGITGAIKEKDKARFKGTIEFFPEEGKYHYDGHRTCKQRMRPVETRQNNGLCPKCGTKVTIGVMHRVDELADRKEDIMPPNARPYRRLIPLAEIIAEIHNVGTATKGVENTYHKLLTFLGNELSILQDVPIREIARVSAPLLAEAIHCMREGRVSIAPGYDGEYGTIKILERDEETKDSHPIDLL